MVDDFFEDIERLRVLERLPANHGPTNAASPKSEVHRTKGGFVKGPIPLTWLSKASKLKGKSPLAVALAVVFAVGLKRSEEVALTTAICQRLGVDRKAKYRGLKMLERAELIKVDRQPRRNPIVRVINYGEP